jgi:hypothetical protein
MGAVSAFEVAQYDDVAALAASAGIAAADVAGDPNPIELPALPPSRPPTT